MGEGGGAYVEWGGRLLWSEKTNGGDKSGVVKVEGVGFYFRTVSKTETRETCTAKNCYPYTSSDLIYIQKTKHHALLFLLLFSFYTRITHQHYQRQPITFFLRNTELHKKGNEGCHLGPESSIASTIREDSSI